MPPKKKDKKKSKKELERERQLEEERLKAEEEARLAEQLRKEQEAQERRQREALEALFAQEKDRFAAEAAELAQIVHNRAARLVSIVDKKQKEIEWQSYLECRKMPNPKNERDLNTYLDQWADETGAGAEKEDDQGAPSLLPLFNELPAAELLCSEIEHQLHGNLDPLKDTTAASLTAHLLRIRQLIHSKWDRATTQILQHVDQFAREPNENFQLSASTHNYAFGVWGNLTKNPRHKVIDFADLRMSTSLPKPLVLGNVSIRMLLESGFTATAEYEDQAVVGKKPPMSVIGGVLNFDLIEMPDPPKTVAAWTIRPMLAREGKIITIAYPFKKPPAEDEDEALPDEDGGGGGGSGGGGPDDGSVWSMHVAFPIEPGCLLHEGAATVRWWNAAEKIWDDEGVSDVEISKEACSIKFKSIHFAPTALVQSTYTELPYADWSLHPLSTTSAHLHVRGVLNDIELEIGPGACRLISPRTPFTEEHLGDKWMNPAILFRRLSRMGANFRAPTTVRGVDIGDLILKNPTVEDQVITSISLLASRTAFRRSPASHTLSSTKCAVQFRPFDPSPQASPPPPPPTVVDTSSEKASTETPQPEPQQQPQSQQQQNTWPLPEDAEWSTLVFDSAWSVADQFHAAGFVVPAAGAATITDATTYVPGGGSGGSPVCATPYHLMRGETSAGGGGDEVGEDGVLFARTVAQVLGIVRALAFS
ncbi:Protein casc1 [Geranomyces variabilis]|uniref:Protein casc1 n=1 Tax=Geranomyces variabilis TaxID=109894 RepID=A0AAD5TQK6_9FUNG|nr:Protein casc1 [Geranomyces variabilis]